MLDVLSSIVQALTTFGNFLFSFFSGILSVFQLVASSLIFLSSSWAVLPPVLTIFVVAGISVCIVFHLIGR